MFRPSAIIEPYAKEIEQSMKEFFNSLSEKDKRRYAAVEAQKLGRSGITYISKAAGMFALHDTCRIKRIRGVARKKHDPRIRRKGGVVDAKAVKKPMPVLMKCFWLP